MACVPARLERLDVPVRPQRIHQVIRVVGAKDASQRRMQLAPTARNIDEPVAAPPAPRCPHS